MNEELIAGLDVSRETFDRLKAYEGLVRKWTKIINLISHNDVADLWRRHIIDSAQIYKAAPESVTWVDLGSGGGFPGLVIAILDLEMNPAREIVMVDSDQRKCAFLRTAVRELGLNARVIAARIDQFEPQGAAVVSARALGALENLLGYAEKHLRPDGMALFPKGKSWPEEHRQAQKSWSYQMETLKSNTNPEGVVLKIKDVKRV